jgi:hypothetical protein
MVAKELDAELVHPVAKGVGMEIQQFYSRIPVPAHLKKAAEPRTKRDSALLPTATRRSRLRFHLEYNAASAGEDAGTKGFVEVEVAACRC